MADGIQTSYLDAIQAVPGDTPGEKFRWMADLIKERLSQSDNLEDVVESEKIPRLLKPLVQIEAAKMLNKKDRENQNAYGAIAEALKSDDELIVKRALKARSFFDGSNQTITNVRYFFDNLFSYVSLNTRTRIIKALSMNLAPKNTALAEEFFTAVALFYGVEQALPLLLACSESFMFTTIIEKRIVLNRRMIKHIFRRNPDFVVRYLRLSKPNTDPCARNLHPVNIYDFDDYLSMLIKKRLDSFVELYEMHEKLPPNITMSHKCAEAFIKNGKEHLQRKPKLYIRLLPLKMISTNRMEAIFPKLFPDNPKDVDTVHMLRYLDYYPQEKKVNFFLRTYEQVYGKSILDDPSKVTVALMKLLPAEERVRQARMKLANATGSFGSIDYKTTWKCYLPLEESLPQFREEIARASEMEMRSVIACKMIYACKVNNDDLALLEILKYIHDRHKNEQAWFLIKVFETLLENYDLPHMSQEHWTTLMDMIIRAHVKKDLLVGNTISMNIVGAAIHYKILRKESIDQLIDILVDLKSMRCTGYWNILQDYPEYERMCLEACVNVVSQKYKSDKTPWKEDRVGILADLCSSIYHFNEAHVNKTSRVERMSIKNYPWLVQAVEEIVSNLDQCNVYIVENLQNMLKKHEKDLHERFWPKKETIADVETGEAFRVLRRNPEHILSHWKEYLKACQDNWYKGHTKWFLKATRWYKEIPVKFVQQCLLDLTQKKEEVCLDILATLVHGQTYAQIIEPLLPSNKTIDVYHEEAQTNYNLVRHVIFGARIVNPPVSLTVLSRLCEGDYLSVALAALINVCRRINAMDVISFARMLSTQRVSVRKHGIRLMYMVAPRDQLLEFLHSQWKTEENYSIREIIFAQAKELFQKEPGPATWSLFVAIFSSLTPKDDSVLFKSEDLLSTAPDEYVLDYLKLAFSMIDKLDEANQNEHQVTSYISDVLSNIKAAICNLLPRDFIQELIRRFFFHPNVQVSNSVHMLVLTSLLLPAKDKFEERTYIFSSVFTEVVKNGWNVPHPKNPRFYPVNYAVHRFVDVVCHTFFHLDMELRLINAILSMFLSVLTPQMDPRSYLLLVYTREQVSAKTPKEFGIKLGQRMPELVNIFSSLFLFFMIDTLQYMLGLNTFKDYNQEDAVLRVIEGLAEVGSTEATLMAVVLLTSVKSNDKEYMERYDTLLTRFSEYDDPVIKSIVCDIMNNTGFCD